MSEESSEEIMRRLSRAVLEQNNELRARVAELEAAVDLLLAEARNPSDPSRSWSPWALAVLATLRPAPSVGDVEHDMRCARCDLPAVFDGPYSACPGTRPETALVSCPDGTDPDEPADRGFVCEHEHRADKLVEALDRIKCHASGDCSHTADEHMRCFAVIEELARKALETGGTGT